MEFYHSWDSFIGQKVEKSQNWELEKAIKDRSHLTQKVVTDKNGHQRKVWVKTGIQPNNTEVKKEDKKEEPKVKYSVMDLMKAKDVMKKKEAQFKKDTEEYEAKQRMDPEGKAIKMYGFKPKPLTEDEDYMKAKKIVDSFNKEDKKEAFLENREFSRDIKGENTVDDLSKQVKFSDKQKKAITDLIKNGDYKKGDGTKLLNDLYSSNRDMYSELTHMNNTIWNRSGKKQSTYSATDLITNKVNELIENTPKENSGKKNSYADLSDKEFIEKYKSEIPSSGRAGTKENFMNNLKNELNFQEELKKKGSSVYSKTKHELLQEIEKRADKISEIYNLK